MLGLLDDDDEDWAFSLDLPFEEGWERPVRELPLPENGTGCEARQQRYMRINEDDAYLRWSAVGFGLGRNVRGDVEPEEEVDGGADCAST